MIHVCILLLYFCFQILVICYYYYYFYISLYFIINKIPGYFFQSHIFQYSIHTYMYLFTYVLVINFTFCVVTLVH